jgi:hypothetical protein
MTEEKEVKRTYLTNERLQGKFLNNFYLTNYAIDLARHKILEGPVSLQDILEELVDVVQEKEEEDIDNHE